MPLAADLVVTSSGATHAGIVRRHNEDAFLARPEIGLWAVADGMGGHRAGDVASRAIADSLAAVPYATDGVAFIGDVRARLAEVNRWLVEEATRSGGQGPIGSTVVALMIFGRFFACLWAGDSRLYRLRGGVLQQITRDHSQVQELIDAGLLASEQAEHHPLRNVITRAVGVGPDLALDKVTDRLEQGDLFLLCSDGLTKMVPDASVAAIAAGAPVDEIPGRLIEAALAAGGADNVTIVAVRVEPAGGEPDGGARGGGDADLRWDRPA